MKRLIAIVLLCAMPAMAEVQPISPGYQGTKTASCTTSTGATALASKVGQHRQLEIQNAGSATIFVEVGDSTIEAAVATGYPVLQGQAKVISISPNVTHIACITSSGTHSLYATIGSGN